ncbi:hypothetical protein OU798_08485 [Prolixibacteraceae bacterium Z1-6]|uniref:Glycosyltransferase RgtA/B/C/D-like domain-containing protein n=1 Tax=Draconibacterium aestuarii TaxID=2998507 RepID=A0A9X3J6D6_9BACT|nr:hypothetical protein [Prolixibacteraceae bacterium Z1-6]
MNVECLFKLKFSRYILLILFFLPLLFINIRSDHNWGGDFAQYINQAKCICEGKNQSETGYVFNDQNSYLGPPVYPVGFPLLLAPVYLFFGNNIYAFSLLISFCLFMMAIILVKLNELYFDRVLAVVLTVAFVYNPWLLFFKASVLSDIPFALTFILSIFFYRNYFDRNRVQVIPSVFLGFLIGYAILIKSIGVAVFLGIFVDRLIIVIRAKTFTIRPFLEPVIASLSGLLLYVLFNYVFFPSETEHFSFFYNLYDLSRLLNTISENYHPNMFLIKNFFSDNLVISSFTLTLFIIGFFRKVLYRADVLDFIFILYSVAVLCFPAYQGFRYLLPVYPIIIIYIFQGFKSINMQVKLKNHYLLPLVVSTLLLLWYYEGIEKVLMAKNYINAGPQTDYSIEAFSYIQSNTDENSIIAFTKPRVMALYSSRKSIAIGSVKNLEEVDRKFLETGVDYLVMTDDLRNQILDNYISHYGVKLKLVWKNTRFKVYKLLGSESLNINTDPE